MKTRTEWTGLADRMLLAARPWGSPRHGRITFPGPAGGYGTAIDGLEGFARTFLMAGFRLAGEKGEDPLNLAEWYAQGIAAGTDPHSDERWVRPSEHGQAKVEAASLALVLDLTRPWIWDRLDSGVQERVIAYFAEVVGDTGYPQNNWLWFRVVVQTFLRSVGGPWSLEDIEADLARHESFRRPDGWFSDGRHRSYDHYAGWALHLYPTLWARMAGAEDLAAPRRERDVAELDRFLQDAVHLVGADGGPLLQGRSLIYRFAAAAPFWTGVLAEVPSVPRGQLKRAASSIVQHFVDHDAPDADNLLTMGWFGPWRALGQSYSGTGSPYWASKGMLGISLPAEHPVWSTPEEPLPIETGDTLRAIKAPGWLVHGTNSDGIVRVLNHGTDKDLPGTNAGDSPLYTRIGYSTATLPPLDVASWAQPFDQCAALMLADGQVAHRAGMQIIEDGPTLVPVDEGTGHVGQLSSSGPQRIVHGEVDLGGPGAGHSNGIQGEHRTIGEVTICSLVRGPWEVRLVRVEQAAEDVTAVRVAGWPATDPLTSRVDVQLVTPKDQGHQVRKDASPLASEVSVPWAELDVQPGFWQAAVITLTGEPDARTPEVLLNNAEVSVRWPDAARSHHTLPH
ncbi:DUF2264 domain-containing protein [Kineosporia babensis]|uniref:DUF2264 domain-containing protein n=1 Tax=Kineosporia babensis TaxID=499548 RepID=A0A9X1ND97_9ACTN|nr:DUF2264 domain-containing protein [Kineosporia babensis]MCD5311993.1 DUF2264 domain-containing protein [Kineosporia babensis]